jgi:RNA polymerase sigma factor (sigma-70 family)
MKDMSNVEKDFVKLINENQGLIHKVSLIYERKDESRKDLFQEIVLQLWRAFPSFKGQSKVTTWMYRIALNTAISFLRKTSHNPESVNLAHAAMCSGDFGLLSYFEYHKTKQVATYDDVENKISYFYGQVDERLMTQQR